MSNRRRIYSELVPLDALARDDSLEELARRRIQLLVAVQPGQLAPALRLLARADRIGLDVGLWPLLDDARGRWLNPEHGPAFETWAAQLLDIALAEGHGVGTLVLDLEPPIDEVRAAIDGELRAARAWLGRRVEDAIHRRLVQRARASGVEVLAAVAPMVLLQGRASRGWQRALGTPLEPRYDRVSAMAYTTLFEGYGLGVVGRPDARAILAHFAREAAARLGPRASVSLGAVGVGALGDEAVYRAPRELAEDVAIARGAGVEDLALFELGGVLARPPIGPWLDALDAAPGAPPSATARASAALAAAYLGGVVLDLAGR